MGRLYLGKLDYTDPLYGILLSQLCSDVKEPLFHVNRMSSHEVYKYTEEKTRIAIIGKFFKLHDTKYERVHRIKDSYLSNIGLFCRLLHFPHSPLHTHKYCP
jgi:hypothetical protein